MSERDPHVFHFIAWSNLVSYLSLVFALASVYFASAADLHYMAACWLLSGVADCFDGMFARSFNRTLQQKQFGKEIDTLIDLLAFGLAPVLGLLLLAHPAGQQAWMLYTTGGWYIFAAIHRLAYFNVTVKEEEKVFYGLPTTEAAALLALLLLWPAGLNWLAPGFMSLGIAMLFPVRIREPKTPVFIVLILGYLALLTAHLWLSH